MSSLPVRILTAVLTFALGVGVANLWLNAWGANEIVCRIPAVPRPPATRLEMVFVLDTTGSMNGLLDGAKQRIWGIVNGVMQDTHSSVRIGLVAYRDRGDEYLTQVLPLTDELDKVYTTLMYYREGGGGDSPEDVRSALSHGVYEINWSPSAPNLSKIMFLVGDAPPHEDYDVVDTVTSAANAVQKGIIVNTIQCGISAETTRAWRAIAERGRGKYFSIASDGGVQAIATPYDEQLGDLARQLGATFVAYGFGRGAEGEAKRAEITAVANQVEARVALSAPPVARAERAVNKAVNSVAYLGDLFQQIENGSVKLEDIDPAQLPEALRSMSASERQQEIERRLAQRRELRHQIDVVSKQRYAYIEAEQKKRGNGEGFDVVVARALKEQMASKF
jgi:hypothetical protein